MEPDIEMRHENAIGALDALCMLIDAQTPGLSVSSESLAPLLRITFEAVKKALPRPRIGSNDDD